MAIQSSNLYEDNKDIQFHINNTIDWDSIVPLREEDFKDKKLYEETEDENLAFAPSNVEEAVEMYKDSMKGFGEICAKEIMEHARAIDEKEIRYENGQVTYPEEYERNVQVLTENGYMGLLLPRKYGGWQFPNTTNAIGAELISAGDAGMATLLGTQDLGDIINKFASEELKQKYIPKIASGEMGAAMLLTEPNYGSDLQNATTKGDKTDDNTFKVNGVKMWITHGTPHTPDGQVFLTVTRTVKKPDGSYRSGAAGLSLLLIDSKDAEIVSLEHKLGIHSSPTVQLSMENSPGYLVGEEGKGLTEYTMSLMNAARLAVAAQSVGVSERALREAWAYAEVREQFGTLIKNLPAVRKMLDEIEISTEASRALVYYTAYAVDMMEGYEEKYKHEGLSAKEIRKQPEMLKWGKLAKVLTPFSKFYAAEEANSNAYKAVQVHGGVGFSEEYDVARQYRDARILSIYEGTSQLQVVAAIGGVTEGYSFDSSPLLQEQKTLRENAQVDEDLKPFVDKIIQTENKIRELIAFFKEQNKTFKGAYAHELVWSAAMVFISHLWLQMAGKDTSGNKAHKAKVYINDTMSYVEATDNKLRSQAEVDYVE